MMDDKKIEDAAKQHSEESYISDYFQACYKDAFMECAKWMQEEFLKDLWHPVSEEPKKGRVGQLSRIVPYRSPSERFMCATLSLTLFFHMEKKDGTYDNREVYVHGFPIKL